MDQSHLPIDIQVLKLLDWILNRLICPRDWQKYVLVVRNKINLAIQDMPEHDGITELLQGSTINYFSCLKIVEILKETEKNSKNIFGMYSSQRMKDWSNIINLYAKNNVYLAEAASILQRNVAYEIPAIKRQINKCKQLQTECETKHTSSQRTISELKQQIKQLCHDLGIEGKNITTELNDLHLQLPSIYDEIVAKTRQLTTVIEFYKNYLEYFYKRNTKELLPTLSFVAKNGNKTVYEWRTGEEPKTIERTNHVTSLSKPKETEASAEIDWNCSVNDDQADGEIDWGDMDTDIVDVALSSDNVVVETVGDAEFEKLKQDMLVQDSGVYIPNDGIAKGDDSFNVLELADTRILFLNDLIHLQTFLTQKLHEMKSEHDNLLISTILQDLPKNLQSFTETECKSFLAKVIELSSYFKQKRVEQLLRINDSPKYFLRLDEQFKIKERSIERAIRNQAAIKEREAELQREEIELNQSLKLIGTKTKELLKDIQQDLSKRHNGRRVNIMGEINLI